MKNTPEKIYLQVGNECPNDCGFEELGEVTWNKDNIYDNDIEYRRVHKGKIRIEKSDLDIINEANQELKRELKILKSKYDVTIIGYVALCVLFIVFILFK